MDILADIKNIHFDDGTEHFPPTNLEITSIDVGNKATNVIPESARAMLNVRFNDLHSGEQIADKIKSITNKFDGVDVSYKISGESFITQPGILSDVVIGACEDVLGKTPELSTTGGTSDARFINKLAQTIEFGITNHSIHEINEACKKDDILKLADIYLKCLEKFFKAC